MLNSFEEFCIMRETAVNSIVRMLNPHGGAYILSCENERGTLRVGRVYIILL